VDSTEWAVRWNSGEFMRVTAYPSQFEVYVGIPLGSPNTVGGAQGEDAGQGNDFKLADGTLYGPYAESWRVGDASSLFDDASGQSTATFTDRGFPGDVVRASAARCPAAAPRRRSSSRCRTRRWAASRRRACTRRSAAPAAPCCSRR
jgi:hypothetical protein